MGERAFPAFLVWLDIVEGIEKLFLWRVMQVMGNVAEKAEKEVILIKDRQDHMLYASLITHQPWTSDLGPWTLNLER